MLRRRLIGHCSGSTLIRSVCCIINNIMDKYYSIFRLDLVKELLLLLQLKGSSFLAHLLQSFG